jgi:3-deoxy-D-manno-octulosonate 8-phosphate phosphatase (KDO 8-P phosphatase)
VCYIGDDLVDVPVLRQVGLAVAPANAEEEARGVAHWITPSRGGDGAVRDLVNLILRAKGKWKAVTERYFKTE